MTAIAHRVEHVDTDASGVVHFSRYASLMETAVLSMLEARGMGLQRLNDTGYDLRIRELRIVYRQSAAFGDLLHLDPGVERFGAASLRCGVVVRNAATGTELASGMLDFALVDAEGRAAVFPPGLRETFEPEVTV